MNDILTTLKELSGGSKFDTFNIQVDDLVVDPTFNLRRRTARHGWSDTSARSRDP